MRWLRVRDVSPPPEREQSQRRASPDGNRSLSAECALCARVPHAGADGKAAAIAAANCAYYLEEFRACWAAMGERLPFPVSRVGSLDCPAYIQALEDGGSQCVKACPDAVMTCAGPAEGGVTCQCQRRSDGALSHVYEPGDCTESLTDNIHCRNFPDG